MAALLARDGASVKRVGACRVDRLRRPRYQKSIGSGTAAALRAARMAHLQATEATFRDMVQAIRAVADPSAIILYGSYARGSASDQSDVDILVIRRSDFGEGESRRKELGQIYRAVAAKSDIPKDIVLLTKSEFEQWRGTTNHIASEALREGRVLYGQI